MISKINQIVVVGMGKSGQAAAHLALNQGYELKIYDDDDRAIENFGSQYALKNLNDLGPMCFVVVSPGVPLDHPLLLQARRAGSYLLSEIEFALSFMPDLPVVAVTGTNGKTTTTRLIGHMFECAGLKTLVAGNVGTPLSRYALEADIYDIVVLEISSFQLDLTYSLKPKVSVILNITPDHLDRYETFADYVASKARIFACQGRGDLLVLNADDPHSDIFEKQALCAKSFVSLKEIPAWGSFFDGRSLWYKDRGGQMALLADSDAWHLLGLHNVQNIMAAVNVAKHFCLPETVILEALHTFKAVEHRLEKVSSVHSIEFVNDSKATNVESLRVALESFQKVILICGGRNKNMDFSGLCPLVAQKVKTLLLLGESATLLEELWSPLVPTYRVNSLKDAVGLAFQNAAEGDTILFSPGCASFDMFKNYEERGARFKQVVQSL